MSKFNLDALDKIEQQELAKKNTEKESTVLCVDDEPSNLSALKMLLEDEYRVLTARSGEEALELIASNQVDVIITDQRMPELLGTELLEELMRRKLSNNVRIILTGFADVSVLMDCINKGLIDRYILKPWSPDELMGTVRSAISRITTKRTLDKLVPERVMAKLYPDGLRNVKVGYGKEIQGAVMFADIQRFTSMIESMTAIDSFKLISSFFSSIGPIIEKHSGFIDKYLGDGVMAIFDNPETSIENCVNCALEMIRATDEYNQTHRSNRNPELRTSQSRREALEISIGLNFGQVVLGTIGCLDRIDVTVLGDAVNTSSRIQGLAGLFRATILASEHIIDKLPNSVNHRYLGRFLVRGKTKGLGTWELFDADNKELQLAKRASKDLFESGIKKIEAGDTEGALAIFKSIVEKTPADKTASAFVNHLTNRFSELFFQMQRN